MSAGGCFVSTDKSSRSSCQSTLWKAWRTTSYFSVKKCRHDLRHDLAGALQFQSQLAEQSVANHEVFNYMQAYALPAVHLVRIRPVLLLG
mmetsp:Transcript_10812/g.25568  ORF Transcript_10812/g.25568 Transcript_10812/m.25568 type:complete len:90 (+) Transcript_10812:510-779(+)